MALTSHQQIYNHSNLLLSLQLFGFNFSLTLCLTILKSNCLFSTQISYFLRSKSFQALKIKEWAVLQPKTFHDKLLGREVNLQSFTCRMEFIQARGDSSESSTPSCPRCWGAPHCSVVPTGRRELTLGHQLYLLRSWTVPSTLQGKRSISWKLGNSHVSTRPNNEGLM